MVWTSPMTAVDGNVFTAAEFNLYVRDNLNDLDSRVTVNASDISTAETDIGTLQSDVTAAEGNITTLQSDVNALESINVGRARVDKSGTQSLTHATGTKIQFGTATYDDSSFWDNANDRFVIPAGLGGVYLITACITFVANATGVRACDIYVNTTRVTSELNSATPALSCRLTASTMYVLAPGDTTHFHRSNSAVGG
jgi:hypothetical protein